MLLATEGDNWPDSPSACEAIYKPRNGWQVYRIGVATGLVPTPFAYSAPLSAVAFPHPLQPMLENIAQITTELLDGRDIAEQVLAVSEEREFAEVVPEYLRSGYRLLMAGDANAAIALWQEIYHRYPSAEICGHISRAHCYQMFFQNHYRIPADRAPHIREMRSWAERALTLNPNSSIGHAMLSFAIGQEALIVSSQRKILAEASEIRHHAEQAVLIDNNWVGHFALGIWHRELAGINPALRAIARFFVQKLPRASYAKSIEHFQQVLKQYPENNFIYAEMAYTYERMGDMRQACAMYKRCITMPLFKHPVAEQMTRIAVERMGKKCRKATAAS